MMRCCVLSSTPVTISHFKRNFFLHSLHFFATHFFVRLSLSLFCWLTCFLSVVFFNGLAAIISLPTFHLFLRFVWAGYQQEVLIISSEILVLVAYCLLTWANVSISIVTTRVWQVQVEVCASFRRQNVNIIDKVSDQPRSNCTEL